MPKRKTVAERVAEMEGIEILTRGDLSAAGMSTQQVTSAVRSGRIMRLRRGLYATPAIPDEVVSAVRIGGRLTCLTLLRLLGIFVLEQPGLHVHVAPHLSRSRRRRPDHAVLHWGTCADAGSHHAVSIRDAVRQSIRCQVPRAAIATLDSVLHHRLLTIEQLRTIFEELPVRFRPLLDLVDGSAESGPETFVRLILRSLGLRYRTQVEVPGVGRVDFLVEGWLVIECDSREFHQGWEKQVEDRVRDIAAARLGYVTIRPVAADIFERQGEVRAAIQEVVSAFGHVLGDGRRPQLRRSSWNRRQTGA